MQLKKYEDKSATHFYQYAPRNLLYDRVQMILAVLIMCTCCIYVSDHGNSKQRHHVQFLLLYRFLLTDHSNTESGHNHHQISNLNDQTVGKTSSKLKIVWDQ